MEETVNIPSPVLDATERRGSDTPAAIRNWPLKGEGAEAGRQTHPPSRSPRVRRAFGRADNGGNHAAEKIF